MSNHFYNSIFATKVVNEFLERYSRATMVFAKVLDIDYFSLVNLMVTYVRGYQTKWEAVKRVIKFIEKNEPTHIPKSLLKEYLTFEKRNYIFEQLEINKYSDFAKIVLDVEKVFGIDYIRTR